MLTTKDILKAWSDELATLDATRDTELTRCCKVASAWIPRVVGFPLETTTGFVARFSGSDTLGKAGEILELHHGHRNVVHPTGFSVTENGTALTTATAYSTTAQVMVIGAGSLDTYVRLIRQSDSWSSGIQHVAVTYTFGFDGADASVPAVPDDIQQLANEIALLAFRSKKWLGTASVAKEGFSQTYEKQLTPQSKDTLRRLKDWAR